MKSLRFIESEIRMPLMTLPVRSTLVSVRGLEILISPGSKIPIETYDPAWPVGDIVASNLLHCAGVPRAAKAYPKARIWGVEGAQQQRRNIAWTKMISPETWPYQNELPVIPLQGLPKVNEVVFVHLSTKTLIVTDLCFNMTDSKGWGARLILSLFGTYQRFAVSKFFCKYIVDKVAFKKSLDEIFAYDFDNIVLSHGQNIMGEGKEKLQKALLERGF